MSPQPNNVYHELQNRAEALVAAFERDYVEPAPVAVAGSALAAMIDHTILKPEATPADVAALCQEARMHGFASVCVNAVHVAQCARLLAGTTPAICSVVGFPLGATLTEAKAYEADLAIAEGATEIDMVISVGMLKGGEYALVHDDIAAVADVCHEAGAILKVIIEAALLSDVEKAVACELIVQAGADFAKTSTGFSTGGATVRDVALMRAAVGPQLGVKAAGGIRTYDTAVLMVAAGATRIGASSSIKIVQGAPA
ncbi:MAG: deoxyribose-phosphate aldolase [Chloroflexi bacterium]|nr:deoxyribose-phosphate aldolase [Chloroflexota bacterium]